MIYVLFYRESLRPFAKRKIASTTIAPTIEEKKLGRLLPILSNELIMGYPNKYLPKTPPTTAPTIPRIVVRTTPPPSGPGMMNLARYPAKNPKINQISKEIILFSFFQLPIGSQQRQTRGTYY
jgi:hypothetical protein